MNLRLTTLTPLLRSLGALALVAFIGAQTMCFIHCHLGGVKGSTATKFSCHAVVVKPCHAGRDSSSPVAPAPMDSCSTLKNLAPNSTALTHIAPEFATLYVLAPFALTHHGAPLEPNAPHSRQANHKDRVFTPEVSLGPAFRSLAPPSIG